MGRIYLAAIASVIMANSTVIVEAIQAPTLNVPRHSVNVQASTPNVCTAGTCQNNACSAQYRVVERTNNCTKVRYCKEHKERHQGRMKCCK